jgi:hypothetical protein
MRIRQVRPEFWSDETLAALADSTRLFYVGLWCIADDAGWIEWRPSRIGALLYPYRTARRREADITVWSHQLVENGRLHLLECGCGHIPTLPRHQRVGGKQTFLQADRHYSKHVSRSVQTVPENTGSNVTLGNVTLGSDRTFTELLAAAGGKRPAEREH